MITQEREASPTEINTDEALKKAGWLHRIRYWSHLFSQLPLCSPPAENTSNLFLTPNKTRKLSPGRTRCVMNAGYEGIPSTMSRKPWTLGTEIPNPLLTLWQLRVEWRIQTEPTALVWSPVSWNSETPRKKIRTRGQGFYVTVYWSSMEENQPQDFSGGPVVKNPPSNAAGRDSIPGLGTKIPHAAVRIPRATTKARCSQINK